MMMSVYISACRYRSGHESGERAANCWCRLDHPAWYCPAGAS